jgi:hypothetical protein
MASIAIGLATPRDWLGKAERETGRVRKLIQIRLLGGSVLELADAAVNAATTIWHIVDRVGRSDEPDVCRAVEAVRLDTGSLKQDSYSIMSEFARSNSAVRLCGEVAALAKHIEVYAGKEPSEADDNPLGEIEVVPNWLLYRKSHVLETVASAGPSNKVGRYYMPRIVIDTNHRVPALDVFAGALDFWRAFFEQHGL